MDTSNMISYNPQLLSSTGASKKFLIPDFKSANFKFGSSDTRYITTTHATYSEFKPVEGVKHEDRVERL